MPINEAAMVDGSTMMDVPVLLSMVKWWLRVSEESLEKALPPSTFSLL